MIFWIVACVPVCNSSFINLIIASWKPLEFLELSACLVFIRLEFHSSMISSLGRLEKVEKISKNSLVRLLNILTWIKCFRVLKIHARSIGLVILFYNQKLSFSNTKPISCTFFSFQFTFFQFLFGLIFIYLFYLDFYLILLFELFFHLIYLDFYVHFFNLEVNILLFTSPFIKLVSFLLVSIPGFYSIGFCSFRSFFFYSFSFNPGLFLDFIWPKMEELNLSQYIKKSDHIFNCQFTRYG